MISQKKLHSVRISKWVLLPLRLFLGITFLYAGIQKLLDPQFFQPTATGYIGKQILAFATTSPLRGFLLRVVLPHASLFGHLVAYGEIAIGLGTLFGLLFRPAAFFGFVISVLFFLSATWRVYPYFYGSDIVFAFSWLTLVLNGPLNTGLPVLDAALSLSLIESVPPQRQTQLASILHYILGTAAVPESPMATLGNIQPTYYAQNTQQQRRQGGAQRSRASRRNFLMGVLTGGASVFTLGIFAYVMQIIVRGGGLNDDNGTTFGARLPSQSSTAAGGTPSTNTIAQVSAVPTNSAVSFTIPSTGDPGVLVHLNSGQFVAYDALCTHAGCQVDYDSGSQLLICPCHGAAFDPAKNAEAVQSPASIPLSAVTIHVDGTTGAITLG